MTSIPARLEALAQTKGSCVFRNIIECCKLDICSQISGCPGGYIADSHRLARELVNFPVTKDNIGKVLAKISRTMKKQGEFREEILDYYHFVKEEAFIPHSEFLKSGVGECAEKTILFQLAVQDAIKCFSVFGRLTEEQQDTDGKHAYNIIIDKNSASLVDAHNPVSSGRYFIPFIFPIKKLRQKEFELCDEGRVFGRRYFLL
jgi:hypothetical protein